MMVDAVTLRLRLLKEILTLMIPVALMCGWALYAQRTPIQYDNREVELEQTIPVEPEDFRLQLAEISAVVNKDRKAARFRLTFEFNAFSMWVTGTTLYDRSRQSLVYYCKWGEDGRVTSLERCVALEVTDRQLKRITAEAQQMPDSDASALSCFARLKADGYMVNGLP